MMGRIYSTAASVIAWLGSGLETPLTTLMTSDLQSSIASLEMIATSEYWTRLWVVQEFVLGDSLEVPSGAIAIDARILVSRMLAAEAGGYWENPIEKNSNLRNCYVMLFTRGEKHQDSSAQWRKQYWRTSFVLVSKFKFCKCADVRDHIYGLLGLINPKELEDFPIVPDYSKSGSLLYVELWERHKAGAGKDYWPRKWLASMYQGILELDDNDENVVRAFAEAKIWERRGIRKETEEEAKEKKKLKGRREIKKEKCRERVKKQNRDKRSGRWTREEDEIEEKTRDDKSVAERRVVKRRGCRQRAKRQRTEQSSIRWTRSKTGNDSGAHAV
jgi:hypothetical protein